MVKTAVTPLASPGPHSRAYRRTHAHRAVRLAVALAAAALLAGFVFAPAASAATGDFIITGRGYGQGEGLSQWGAWQGAREGNTYQQILAFYYPGTTLSQVSSVAPTRQTVTVRITTTVDTFANVQLTASVTSATLVDSTGATIQTLAAGDSVTLVYNGGKVQVSGADATYSYVDLRPDDPTGRVTVKPSDGLWSQRGPAVLGLHPRTARFVHQRRIRPQHPAHRRIRGRRLGDIARLGGAHQHRLLRSGCDQGSGCGRPHLRRGPQRFRALR